MVMDELEKGVSKLQLCERTHTSQGTPQIACDVTQNIDAGESVGASGDLYICTEDDALQLPTMILSNVRSLSGKYKELVNVVSSKKVYADCWVMCFTETWLSSRTPTSALQLDGFTMLRADRTEDAQKKHGGGLCFYVNQRWCTDVKEVSRLCSPELETLTITFNAREAKHTPFVLIAVYIPCRAVGRFASEQLAKHIKEMEKSHPGSVILALGDFNHVKLKEVLPKYRPQIFAPTREGETLDQCYYTKPHAFDIDMDIPLGNADHNIVYLTPRNIHLYPQSKPHYPDDSNQGKTGFSLVQDIMESVHLKLEVEIKLYTFLMNKIRDLKTERRELVGFFGKTGAGKSSLINAILEERDLLPYGKIRPCTSTVITVEANLNSPMYEADIKFINKEEWKDELWSMLEFCKKNSELDEEQSDFESKLSALYQEEWREKSPEELMTWKQLRKEIPEFFQSKTKTLKKDCALTLSTELCKFTRSSPENPNEGATTLYWPLVKSVTIKVPENQLLQHVTLVDLPGSGDPNKSRDRMWKEIIGKCSTVCIVAELKQAATEKEPWEILEDACRLMGNGGECQRIYFICTKSDDIDDKDDSLVDEIRAHILHNNAYAKEQVKKEFGKLEHTRKHFAEECFKVFTVSSNEFQSEQWLNRDETEIPSLQKILQKLNDDYSETYASGAYGILSLIKGARQAEAPKELDARKELEQNLRHQLETVREAMNETCEAFDRCLAEGVERSKHGTKLDRYLSRKDGRGFDKILKAACENSGIYKPKKKREINLNAMITSHLTDSIDETFRKTFPNGVRDGPFNGAIKKFSLNTDGLIEKYKDVELQLRFLQTEEEQMKTKLYKVITERKKKIYNSLTENIAEDMDECYLKAAEIRGKGALDKMRGMILQHLTDNIFHRAKDEMMKIMRDLQSEVLETLRTQMQESIDMSLKANDAPLPCVSSDLRDVEKYFDNLNSTGRGRSTRVYPSTETTQ